MGMVQLDPDAGKRPVLMEGGLYGPGQPEPFAATVAIASYVPLCPAGEGPAFDPEFKRDHYCSFGFRIESETYGSVLVFAYEGKSANSGSREETWIRAAGVPVEMVEDGNGKMAPQYDDETVPRELAAIRVKPARADKNSPLDDKGNYTVWYTGNVVEIVGAS